MLLKKEDLGKYLEWQKKLDKVNMKNQNKCKFCKNWRQIEVAIDVNPIRTKKLPFGDCDKCAEYSVPYIIDFKTGTIGVEGNCDKVYYQDYESYSASHVVGENFGCIFFEKRGKYGVHE